jgi:hypothetical protein
MRRIFAALLAGLCVGLAPVAGRGADPLPAGTAWHAGDVDSAFARARRENKPLFLYWGAVWCPPCNQVKATVFSRQDFIARSRLFVPVYVDGDAPGAQQLGGRFKVSAYPTMVLFRPDGTEITRLPGEVDGDRYMRVLALGAATARPVSELLASARRGRPLSGEDWRLLAFYSWETDGQAVVPRGEMVPTLWQLALASNHAAPDASARLALKAMTAASRDRNADAPFDKAAALQRLRAMLASPAIARANFAELAYAAGSLPAYLTVPGSPAREQLLREWDRWLLRQSGDGTLARLDQLAASDARVSLARIDMPKGALPLALQTEVRAVTHRATREATDRYEREAVITASAQLLADAGLLDESDALLNAELKHSATPYYLMLGLASNARQRGESRLALSWYEQAHAAAQGAATRLQWGTIYVQALVDLAPTEAARIEHAARSVLGELEPRPETFHGRNRAALGRLGARLNEWNKDGSQIDVLVRLREQLASICAKLPAPSPERATCNDVLAPGNASGNG